MSDPSKYTVGYDYSSYQASNPSDPLPGNQVDNDLANIAQSIDEIVEAVKDVRRSDGALVNNIVTYESLEVELQALVDPVTAIGSGTELTEDAADTTQKLMSPSATVTLAAYRYGPTFLDLGGVADGVTDNSAAFAAAVAGNRRLIVPGGTYAFTQAISQALSENVEIICIGVVNFYFNFTPAGYAMVFTQSDANKTFVIRGDFRVIPGGSGPMNCVHVSYPSLASHPFRQVYIESINGVSDTSSTTTPWPRTIKTLLKLTNCWWAEANVHGYGFYEPGTATASAGLELAGGQYASIGARVFVRWFYGQCAIYSSAYTEGLYVLPGSQAIGCNYFYYLPSSVSAGGAATTWRGQSLNFNQVHGQTWVSVFSIDKARDIEILGGDWQRTTGSTATNWDGALLNDCANARVMPTTVQGSTGTGTATGARLTGTTSHTHIKIAKYENLNYAFILNASGAENTVDGWAASAEGSTPDAYTIAGDDISVTWRNADGSEDRIANESNRPQINLVNTSSGEGPEFRFMKYGASLAAVGLNENIGDLWWRGYDGSAFRNCALIRVTIPATPGASDMPGAMAFYTTADGAASVTLRGQLQCTGNWSFGTATDGGARVYAYSDNGSYTALAAEHSVASGNTVIDGLASAASGYTGAVSSLRMNQSATASAYFIRAISDADGSPDIEFSVDGVGQVKSDGASLGTPADYAEYMKTADGLEVGVTVTVENCIVRATRDGDDPSRIFGVVRPKSGEASLATNSAELRWSGKYLRDDFGGFIYKDVTYYKWHVTVTTTEYSLDKKTGEVYESHVDRGYSIVNTVDQLPEGAEIPEGAKVVKEVDVARERVLNPDYDPTVAYIPRKDRPGWECIGLIGQCEVRKDQLVGDRWLLLEERERVNVWLVR